MKKSYLLLFLTSAITADPELYFIEPKDGETYSKEVAVKSVSYTHLTLPTNSGV